MKQQGWAEGKGLGKSKIGMSEALSTEGGQKPKDKSGFGYIKAPISIINR